MSLQIGAGDEVIVPPRTFLATASSVVIIGAKPVFADVDRNSQNITPASIRKVLTSKTKAIICVHVSGWPCEMDSILELARERNIYVIEDCAQAHGAIYKDNSVGTLGHIGAWSFCQDKIISTTGEGGMITTDDDLLWDRIWSYKDHGKNWDAVYKKNPPGYRWVHEGFGTNWRMTEIQAAVGRIQLQRVNEWHKKRQKNAEAILSVARNCPALRVPKIPSDCEHAWYRCHLFIRPEILSKYWTRDRIIEEINRRGVPCFSGSCSEVYLEKAFDNTGWRPEERLPIARELGETSLMFLVHPTLRDFEIELTMDVLQAVMGIATK